MKMRKWIALSAVAALLMMFLPACAKKEVLNVTFFGEYISNGSDDSMNIYEEFEKKFNCKINPSWVANNEELYTKLSSGAMECDVVVVSDYMIEQMITEELLQKLDFENIPNYEYIYDDCKNLAFDKNNEYSVPYMTGTVAVIYNKTKVTDPVDSWDIFWNEKYKGDILMFRNQRDAIAVAEFKLGYSVNTTDETQIKAAMELLKSQKPLVQAYVNDEIFDKMESGEAALGIYYAGDAVSMMENNEDLEIAFPKEGVNWFVDSLVIPKIAKNKELAEKFINFMNEPEVAQASAEFTYYTTPNKGAYDLLDEDFKNNPYIYPDLSKMKTETFSALPKETNRLIGNLWTELFAG